MMPDVIAQQDTAAPGRPALEHDEVHIWSVDVAAWSGELDFLKQTLDAKESERASCFLRAADRLQYIVAHGVLRLVLGRYAALAPGEIAFRYGAAGKPSLAWPTKAAPIAFNLSHSGDVVLVAVTSGAAVGVDVERWSAGAECAELVDRFFSLRERAEFSALSGDRRVAGFFAGWTRKEAYIKATGLGVSEGLDYFDMIIDPDASPRLIADRRVSGAEARWQMYDVQAGAGYSAAVAIERASSRAPAVLPLRLSPPSGWRAGS